MRIYIIGLMVGVIGLLAANQLLADEYCCGPSRAMLSIGSVTVERIMPEPGMVR